jgi:hypothetical protein
MSELIWQPNKLNCWPNLEIEISRSFVELASNLHITDEGSYKINTHAKDVLEKEFKCNAAVPFNFYEDTYLVMHFNITGGGRWFASNNPTYGKPILDVFPKNQNIVYSGHNIDTTMHTLAMFRLMDIWTTFFPVVKEMYEKKI